MINQKTKKISAIIILFIVILRIATCGELNRKGKEEERVRGPHEPTEPVIFDSYPEMTKVSFRETLDSIFRWRPRSQRIPLSICVLYRTF